jgi:hypothetical protein
MYDGTASYQILTYHLIQHNITCAAEKCSVIITRMNLSHRFWRYIKSLVDAGWKGRIITRKHGTVAVVGKREF